jgi:hypothetical protein
MPYLYTIVMQMLFSGLPGFRGLIHIIHMPHLLQTLFFGIPGIRGSLHLLASTQSMPLRKVVPKFDCADFFYFSDFFSQEFKIHFQNRVLNVH